METDQTLLDAARTMDKEALVKIFDLYSPALFKYALRLCSDPVAADHIVGDVFAKLLEQLSTGNGPTSNLRSYLYEMTYHRMIDEVRYSRRRAPLDVVESLRGQAHPAFSSVDDQILFQQLLQALQNELTNDQRNVVVLRFLEDLSLRETAAVMGKTVDHVKVIQSRAIAALRRSLAYQGVRKSVPSLMVRNVSKAIGMGN